MLDPLSLPAPQGYGYGGDGGLRTPFSAQFAYNMGELPRFEAPMRPEQVTREIGYDSGAMPDSLRIVHGAGDRQIVGELLNLAQGEPSNLRGVSQQLARDMLARWGYPDHPDAWSYDEWAQALAAAAAVRGPMVGY